MNPLARQTYFERFSPFPYGSPEWRIHYNKRVSVARVSGRLKTYRKLNDIRRRGLGKVQLHVSMSVLTVCGSALSRVLESRIDDLRTCVPQAA